MHHHTSSMIIISKNTKIYLSSCNILRVEVHETTKISFIKMKEGNTWSVKDCCSLTSFLVSDSAETSLLLSTFNLLWKKRYSQRSQLPYSLFRFSPCHESWALNSKFITNISFVCTVRDACWHRKRWVKRKSWKVYISFLENLRILNLEQFKAPLNIMMNLEYTH